MLKLVKMVIVSFIIAVSGGNANAQMFGRSEVKYDDIKDFRKWKDVVSKYEMDVMMNDSTTQRWKDAVTQIKNAGYTREQQIVAVNDLMNRSIRYEDDSMVWGRSDYWASPTETFQKGAGDCEDYAAAKYFTLKMLGFKDEDMRIVVLKDTRKNELHAILVVENRGMNYVLDNQNQNVVADTQIAYYQPIYSINQNSWWKHS